MDAHDPEGGQKGEKLAQGPDIRQAPGGSEAHERRLARGLEEIDVTGVDHPTPVPPEVQQHSISGGFHGPFLP
jgi:hypothetical protein